jgi:hypothetical protein
MKSVLFRCQIVWVLAFFMFYAQSVIAQEESSQAKHCSNATLKGSFGYSGIGTLLPASTPPPFAGPFGEVGRQTFDAEGNTNGTATLSANGNINKVTIQGTYAVNADCTGSMTLSVSPLAVIFHGDFVVDDSAAEIRVISTDAGVVETRVYKKQSRGRTEE